MNSFKLLFFTSLTILLTSGMIQKVFAQNDSKFRVHLQGGIAGSQVAGDGLSGFNKLNLFGGLGVSTSFSDQWSLGFEINYAQKGSKRIIDPERNNGQDEYKMSLSYIQIPILFSYDHNDKLGFKVGPCIGLLIDSKEEDFLGEVTTNPEFETLEFSGIISVNYKLSDNLGTELRFDQSLLPIRQRDSGATIQLDGRQFNSVLTLMVSYTIN